MTLDMLKTWAIHSILAAAMNGVALLVGIDPVVGVAFYVGHEVVQHQINGTHGFWGWVDRIGDVGGPALVSAAMLAFLA